MSKDYEETGTNILTGAVIFSTFFLLVAVLASVSSGFANVSDTTTAAKPAAVETVVVAAPHAKES